MEKCFTAVILMISLILTGCQSSRAYPERMSETAQGQQHSSQRARTDSVKSFERIFAKHDIQFTRQGEKIRLILPTDHFFEQDVNHQNYQDPDALHQVVRFYKQFGGSTMQIIGYTDDIGDEDKLVKQSNQRANSVAAFLWANGIPRNKLIVKYKNGHQQLDDRKLAKASAANRRVEIRFYQSEATAHPQ